MGPTDTNKSSPLGILQDALHGSGVAWVPKIIANVKSLCAVSGNKFNDMRFKGLLGTPEKDCPLVIFSNSTRLVVTATWSKEHLASASKF